VMLTKKEKRDVHIFLHFCLCKINIPNLELLLWKASKLYSQIKSRARLKRMGKQSKAAVEKVVEFSDLLGDWRWATFSADSHYLLIGIPYDLFIYYWAIVA